MNGGQRSRRPYPHGDTICAGCHSCQPERFPNTSAAYCSCDVCKPGGMGLCEVVVNDVRYVREETLFAAMREVERLREYVRGLGGWLDDEQ